MTTPTFIDMQILREVAAEYRNIPADRRSRIAAALPSGQTLDFYMGAYYVSSKDAQLAHYIADDAGEGPFMFIALTNGYYADTVVRMLDGDDSSR